jgi:outer membrane protein assembly factor BamB
VYAVEAATGKEKWKFKTGGIVHADPVLSNDTLFIGSYDGKMYALSVASGRLIWEFKTVGDRYFPKGEIQKAALISGDAVIFGSRDFNIYAISKSTGAGLWNRKEAGSWIIATPLLYNGNLFYGTSDSHSFYSTSQEDGSTNWKVPIPFRSYNTPVVFNSRLYAGCFNGVLYELDPASGKIHWQFSTVGKQKNGQTIFDANDQLRKDFKMYGNEEETARAERMIFNVGAILATPLLRNGVLYFGATDGYFYAVGLR